MRIRPHAVLEPLNIAVIDSDPILFAHKYAAYLIAWGSVSFPEELSIEAALDRAYGLAASLRP
jgi:hypothetical protein